MVSKATLRSRRMMMVWIQLPWGEHQWFLPRLFLCYGGVIVHKGYCQTLWYVLTCWPDIGRYWYCLGLHQVSYVLELLHLTSSNSKTRRKGRLYDDCYWGWHRRLTSFCQDSRKRVSLAGFQMRSDTVFQQKGILIQKNECGRGGVLDWKWYKGVTSSWV